MNLAMNLTRPHGALSSEATRVGRSLLPSIPLDVRVILSAFRSAREIRGSPVGRNSLFTNVNPSLKSGYQPIKTANGFLRCTMTLFPRMI